MHDLSPGRKRLRGIQGSTDASSLIECVLVETVAVSNVSSTKECEKLNGQIYKKRER